MSEVVDSSDPEFVLRVLETCLLTQWDDVTREGGTIVLRGLGPSHRAVNRNDRTIFTAVAAEGSKTTIAADVTFQASALVGTAAPQNEMVQRKLDSVLEMVRMDLDLAQRRRAQAAERAAERVRPTLVPRSEGEVAPREISVEQKLPDQVPEERKPEIAQVAPEPIVREEPMVDVPEMVEPAAVEVMPWGAAVEAREESPAPHFAGHSEAPPAPPSAPRPVTYSEAPSVPMSEAPSVRSFEPPTVPFSMHHSDPQDDVDIAAEDPIAFRDPVPVAGGRPIVAEEILLVHREDADDEIDDREPVSGIGKVFVTLLVLVALAGLGWVGWQHRAQIEQTQAWTASRAWVMNFLGKSAATGAVTGSAPAAAPPSAAALPPVGDSGSASGTASDAGPPAGSTPAASGSASTLTEGPVPAAGTSAGGGTSVAGPPASSTSGVAATPTPEDAAAAEKAAQEEKLSELDPAKWLQNWADAMRGTDAALLAQYYADPVNRYYLQSHVSRARVMADKEATIAKREQPWTVHLENVQVLDQTQTTARVLLIKHFSMGAGATARQVRWPTQLRLKTIDGRWEITAEQTLGE